MTAWLARMYRVVCEGCCLEDLSEQQSEYCLFSPLETPFDCFLKIPKAAKCLSSQGSDPDPVGEAYSISPAGMARHCVTKGSVCLQTNLFSGDSPDSLVMQVGCWLV